MASDENPRSLLLRWPALMRLLLFNSEQKVTSALDAKQYAPQKGLGPPLDADGSHDLLHRSFFWGS